MIDEKQSLQKAEIRSSGFDHGFHGPLPWYQSVKANQSCGNWMLTQISPGLNSPVF